MISSLASVVLAYFCGSIPFGLLLTKWKVRKDVRTSGSGNIGATNVARVAGKKLAAVVLLLDALKGALPVVLVRHLFPENTGLHAGVAVAAFLGHVFPIWLSFKGGKGVATALGVWVVLMPWAALAGVLAYAGILALWRVSSVGSLIGGLVAISLGFVLEVPRPYSFLGGLLFLLMIFTHRSNIHRLLSRTEKPVG